MSPQRVERRGPESTLGYRPSPCGQTRSDPAWGSGTGTVENIEQLCCRALDGYEPERVFGPWGESQVREPAAVYATASRAPGPVRTRFEPSWPAAARPPHSPRAPRRPRAPGRRPRRGRSHAPAARPRVDRGRPGPCGGRATSGCGRRRRSAPPLRSQPRRRGRSRGRPCRRGRGRRCRRAPRPRRCRRRPSAGPSPRPRPGACRSPGDRRNMAVTIAPSRPLGGPPTPRDWGGPAAGPDAATRASRPAPEPPRTPPP